MPISVYVKSLSLFMYYTHTEVLRFFVPCDVKKLRRPSTLTLGEDYPLIWGILMHGSQSTLDQKQ